MTLTDADIQGADLSEPLVLFGIAIQKVPGEHSQQRPLAGSQTRYVCHLALLSRSLGNRWTLARVVVTTR